MKHFYALLIALLSVTAFASVPTRIDNDVVIGGYLKPKTATGQALGSSLFQWEGYFNTINGGTVLSSSRTINTTAPLTGGGDLSSDRTFAIPKATSLVDGYLFKTDWSTFNNKAASTVTITPSAPLAGGGDLSTNRTISIPAATSSVDGYLSTTNFAAFNNKAASTVTLTATAPITGGGDLSANRSFGCTTATTSAAGCISAADFTAHNNKAASTISIATTAPLTGGGDLSASRTLALTQGSLTTSTSGVTIAGGGSTVAANISVDVATAGAASAGLVSTAAQTMAGVKTFTSKPIVTNGFAIQAPGGSNVTLLAPANLAAAYTFQFPPNMGTNTYILQTDGTSTLTWVAPSAGGGGTPADCSIERNTPTGFGSSGTRIRTYSTQVSVGSCSLTSTSDATNGDKITIGASGYYCVWRTDARSAATGRIGASVNDSNTTTALSSIATANVIMECVTPSGERSGCGSCRYFTASDIIRPHGDGSEDSSNDHSKLKVIKLY